ncbi:MAG: 2Fe-2S iron-sulfur cluster-binding protein, partial [Acidimicrobiia bacterium]
FEKNPKPSKDEIKEALAGNLCRCTGYGAILRAFEELSGGGK